MQEKVTQTRRKIQSIGIAKNYKDDIISSQGFQKNVVNMPIDMKESMNIERRERRYKN